MIDGANSCGLSEVGSLLLNLSHVGRVYPRIGEGYGVSPVSYARVGSTVPFVEWGVEVTADDGGA